MDFNKAEFDKFRGDLQKALEPVEKAYGLRISQGLISYNSTSFTTKLTAEKIVGNNGESLDPEKENFNQWCKLYHLTPEDYKARCRISGESDAYIISGININARKNAIKISRERDGKQYVCSRAMIQLERESD